MRFFVFSAKSKFDPIWVPTWLHFGILNRLKSKKNRFQEASKKRLLFGSIFCSKLAPFWDPSWDPRAAQDGSKTPPKTFQNHWKIVSFLNPFSNAFLDRFLVHFASQLASKIHWNVSKIDAKMHSILDFMFGSIFGWILLPTWIPWSQFGTSGLAPNAFFRVFVFSEKSMFDPILVPTWLHFGSQKPLKSTQKSIPRGIQKMIDFWINFLPKLAPFWDPSWNPRAAQDGPKTAPKTFPRRHQDSPRATRASKIEIWSIFGPKVRCGTPPWPRFFEVFNTFKFKCWCQICARELGKFYIKF